MLRSLIIAAATLAVAGRAPDPKPAFFEPSFSPDRSEIVFVSGGDLWTVNARGGDAHLVVSNAATEGRPLFSPDGRELAFTSTRTGNGDIYVLTLATGRLRRVTYDDGNDQLDAWSRDGMWLYFSSSSHDIAGMNDVYRVGAEGGTPMPVAADRYASEYMSSPAPDGVTLAITARGITSAQWWRKGHSHLDESELWLVTMGATPAYRRLSDSTGGGKDLWPMWSRDGRTVYYMSDRGGAENIWKRASAGGAATQVTHFRDGRLLWPQISLDGAAIVFERAFGIWTLDVASGEAKEVPIALKGVAAGPAVDHLTLTSGLNDLALSPDGKKAAFVAHGELFAVGAKEGGDAARVTATAAAEAQVAWAPDSRRIAYSSDRDGAWHLFVYDFVTRQETRLTNGTGSDVSPLWSPDGKTIVFARAGRELRAIDVASGAERLLATGRFNYPPLVSDGEFAFSPDGKWLAFLDEDDHGYGNAWLVPAVGGERHQASFLSNANAGSLRWSADATYLLYTTSQRTEDGSVVRIDLEPRAPKFREDLFRELFPGDPRPTRTDSAPPPAAGRAAPAQRDTAKRTPSVEPVFDGIRRRATVLPLDIDAGTIRISPDGKTLLVAGGAAGQQQLWTWSLDETAATPPVLRQLTTTPGFKSRAQFSPDGKEVWYLEGGRIAIATVESRATRPLAVSAEMDVDFAQEKMEALHEAWTYLRDNFFDEKMNGADWNALGEVYRDRVVAARTPDEMRRLLNLMIGELNASHSGAGAPGGTPPYTGRLGAQFDRLEYEKHGRLRLSAIVPLGPLALARDAKVGDYLLAVDGTDVGARVNIDALLAYKIGKRVTLTVAAAPDGARRDIAVRPIGGGAEKNLLYRAWVEERRAYVAKASGGRLGYVHMPDMGAGALNQLFIDLDAENQSRDGVVVDVRNNNGGFVNPYAIDVFARRGYLTFQGRGQAQVGGRSQVGQRALEKPTVLVTNQHSLSDAEDFTEGYRALKLGPVVGEPTAGWIVFTWGTSLIDGTTLRLPRQRIRGADGRDMEMAPRQVDVRITRPMGESYTGRDSQLDGAVAELLKVLR